MARTHQQVSGALTSINEQTHNGWQLAIDEVEEQARRLSIVEQNVDAMRAAMEWVEAWRCTWNRTYEHNPLSSLHNSINRFDKGKDVPHMLMEVLNSIGRELLKVQYQQAQEEMRWLVGFKL